MFGTTEVKKMDAGKIKLPRAARVELKKSKLKSLRKKYISIPTEWRSFYPNVDDVSPDEEIPPKKKTRVRKKLAPKKKRRVGRPSNPKPGPAALENSILRFFSPLRSAEIKQHEL